MNTKNWVGMVVLVCLAIAGTAARAAEPAAPQVYEVKNARVEGTLEGERARLVIEADLGAGSGRKEQQLWSATFRHRLEIDRRMLKHSIAVDARAIRGGLRELLFPMSGTGEIRSVTGPGLEDWSVRRNGAGVETLVLRLATAEKPVTEFAGQITAETRIAGLGSVVRPLALTAEQPAMGNGWLTTAWPKGLAVEMTNSTGLVSVPVPSLPETLRESPEPATRILRGYRFLGSEYGMALRVVSADPEAGQVSVGAFRLEGDLSDSSADFMLSLTAKVVDPDGGRLELLSGDVALSETMERAGWEMTTEEGRFVAWFRQAGEYSIRLRFHAGVRSSNEWNRIAFRVAAGVVSPIELRGLDADTRLELAGASRPERGGVVYRSHLPASGRVEAAWRAARPESEGRLFYSAEAVTQVSVSPGLLRQTTLLEMRVMQGEMTRAMVLLKGEGEVTRVQGPQVLSWSVQPGSARDERRLVVQFNQPQKELASVQVQIQRTLGAFPLAFETVQAIPEGATRLGGYVRVVNEGAVRLEVLESTGLSQISPEQFVASDVVKAMLPQQATQVFAYRFAGPNVRMRVQADNILSELSVSVLAVYHLGETDLALDAELEIEVREAPLRELTLRVPKGYALAKIEAAGASDHFLAEPAGEADAVLRLVYGSPVIGRQVVQLRFERNQPLGGARWDLPRIEVLRAKSVRGNIGVAADTGFRLTPAATSGLSELATAFFPKRVPGLQSAFRVTDAGWQAASSVERMAQSIQADVLHLFSVGEGIAYGSSLVNYAVSGAPVSVFEVELSGEYFNVEFTGKNVRNWQKTERGYRVQLHTPVTGAYTLLAAYERPFKAQGESLEFSGARPADAQTEQGYTLVISANQFQVTPETVTGSLTPLETGEVPAEYRLFFDAPILAAYRYTARPFNLRLELKPLAQAEVVSQVVDRAALTTRISEEGQIVTEGRYFVKNKGAPHLRLRLPQDSELWSVTVDGTATVPVKDAQGNLIPLPPRTDPNVMTEVRVKMASRSRNPKRMTVAVPVVSAPVLFAEWRVEPASGRRLVYRGGTLTPAVGEPDSSGFAELSRLLESGEKEGWLGRLVLMGLSVVVAASIWSRSTGKAPRFGVRHLAAGVMGGVAALVALMMLKQMAAWAVSGPAGIATDLRFVAPIQPGDVAWRVDVANIAHGPVGWWTWGGGLLLLVAFAVAVAAWLELLPGGRPAGLALAWALVFWAALRSPAGVGPFVLALGAFAVLQVLLPALWRWWTTTGVRTSPMLPAAVAGLVVLGIGGVTEVTAAEARPAPGTGPGLDTELHGPRAVRAESVTHELEISDEYVTGRATLRWSAAKGAVLPLFTEPGVLLRSGHPTSATRLVQVARAGRRHHLLVAETNGWFEFLLEYQVRVMVRDGERGFAMPVVPGLVNRVGMLLGGMDVDVVSPHAVWIRRESTGGGGTNTVASLVLSPVNDAWIAWRPRTRDTRKERAIYFAEIAQAFVPVPGAVEGVHEIQIRPAQGELGELVVEVPEGTTITDVQAPGLVLWRFDPDTRDLRATFSPAHAKPFGIVVRSQVAATPLPFERTVGSLAVRGAAGQIGWIGVATGSEVQLGEVRADGLTTINLEDFPASALAPLQGQVAGLTLRRAFRHPASARLGLGAVAVEPDVRVEGQQTLSLSEDRVVLAATVDVDVSRAGIFKLSFPLPAGLDVEQIGGAAMTHWTELKTDGNRLVTLHLRGKTEGKHRFNLSLTGPGVKSTNGWAVPRISFREASKYRGQVLVVPEQGLRLQVVAREGVTQLDPQQIGVRQRGVMAFRILQDPWNVTLDLEQVDAWIQVTSLQHVAVAEAQIKISANLQYEIENTGVKALVVRLPAAADGVRFRGEQVGDFRIRPGAPGLGMQDWEIKLDRRVIGKYLLQATYHLSVAEQVSQVVVDGVQAQEVSLQRGFVTVQSGGRLQVRVVAPGALQSTDWQVIPRALQQDIAAPSANFTYRLVDAAFKLPVELIRHEAARLLPARVNSLALTSVISDDGATLTRVTLKLVPGDKRLLQVTLPREAKFWFAFVNRNSVWPWQATNQVLIPLEQDSRTGQESTVEFYYTGSAGKGGRRSLDLGLLGPRMDLPLENITWTVFLNEKWKVTDWSGSLQLQGATDPVQPAVSDVETYVQTESQRREEKTKEAEQALTVANRLLQEGDPQQARQAFKAAFGLSLHDQAFNEDARVQLNNLKLQQALVGINVRQARVAGANTSQAAAPAGLLGNPFANYSQSEAKQILERNTAEENAVQTKLAERLIQQQDAAVSSPAAIRATLPEQGRRLVFTRPLEINASSELKLGLEVESTHTVGFGWKLFVVVAAFAGGWLLVLIHERLGRRSEAA